MKQREAHIKNLCDAELCLDMSLKHEFKQLKIIEEIGHKLALDACNIPMDEAYLERRYSDLKAKVAVILPNLAKAKALVFNTDPRGYFLKIDDSYVYKHNLTIQRDSGGYGIICPEGI